MVDEISQTVPAETASVNPVAEGTKYKLLVIDDDKVFLKILKDWFTMRGFEVYALSDANEAFKLLATEKINVVLSDVVMYPMNGLDILAKIKGDPKTKDIPVFMLSQLGEEDYMTLAKDLGAEEYLIKANFSLKDLVQKIDEVLKRQPKSTPPLS